MALGFATIPMLGPLLDGSTRPSLTHSETLSLFLALAVLLGTARIFGELAVKLRQPAVLGEIIAGILLGPTVLGYFAPGVETFLFPTTGNFPIALDGFTTVSITMFLLVAGMEVDLSSVARQGKAAFRVGFQSMLIPLAVGFGLGYFLTDEMGAAPGAEPLHFALFLATAMSISALPVIVKILMDLNLFRTDLGMMVVASAIIHDIVGWNLFALVLGLAGSVSGGPHIGVTIGLTVVFVGGMLTVGKWLLHRTLPYLQAHTTWPGGVLGLALAGGLLCAAFTEWLGIHAIFGAFIFGVALGDSSHLRASTRSMLENFISFIFAPIFFASIGLKINFLDHFNPLLTLVIVIVGSCTMVFGARWAARQVGWEKREATAIGLALNARGVMEIILALLAWRAGLIGEELLVALVIMALFTSVTSGSLIQLVLKRVKSTSFRQYISGRSFVQSMAATNRREAIDELAQAVSHAVGGKASEIAEAAWIREQQMSTGLDRGIAVPHARMPGIKQPAVAVGISAHGIDFDTKDGMPTHLVFLIVTPLEMPQAQLEILADISKTFHPPGLVEKVIRVKNYTEFLAFIKSEAIPANGKGH